MNPNLTNVAGIGRILRGFQADMYSRHPTTCHMLPPLANNFELALSASDDVRVPIFYGSSRQSRRIIVPHADVKDNPNVGCNSFRMKKADE